MNPGFTIKRKTVRNGGFEYTTFRLAGWLNGERIRRQFKDRAEAEGEKQRLEVAAANREGRTRPVNTRLTESQVAIAETLFALTPDPLAAVHYFLKNYRPSLVSVPVEFACAEFMRDREGEVSVSVVVDYRKVTKMLVARFPGRKLDTITTAEIEAVMATWGQSKKSWNNVRTYLHAFFEFALHNSRRWVGSNPVKPIVCYKIARGIPEIVSADRIAEMFAFLETYSGPPRSGHKPGYLVPYFALAAFAGIRPSVRDGEIRKIHELPNKDLVIAISEHPLIVRNAMDHVGIVRRKFGLGDDVLRHTFISMYVAKFKSVGAAALEAGNSERIIKKHYLNRVTDQEAERFWAVCPSATDSGNIVRFAQAG